jgi:ABC-type microcin C transport system permease subunit YejB
MPFGDFVNNIPPLGFLIIHIVLFAIGSYFAWRSFGAGVTTLGWAFSLFALAEVSYMTYHLDWTTFLFAHTISEVLDLGAFVLVFVAASQSILRPSTAAARA